MQQNEEDMQQHFTERACMRAHTHTHSHVVVDTDDDRDVERVGFEGVGVEGVGEKEAERAGALGGLSKSAAEYEAQREIEKERDTHTLPALMIQQALRAHIARNIFYEVLGAASKSASVDGGVSRDSVDESTSAALTIQQALRAHIARNKYYEVLGAASKSASLDGGISCDSVDQNSSAALMIQQALRAHIARNKYYEFLGV